TRESQPWKESFPSGTGSASMQPWTELDPSSPSSLVEAVCCAASKPELAFRWKLLMHERTPWNQGGPAPRDIRWPSGSVSATIPDVSDEIASREAMNLESQLWREVSEHLELGESIRRIAAVLS